MTEPIFAAVTPTGAQPPQHRVLVTGSRDWTDTALIAQAFDAALALLAVPVTMQHTVTLVHGDARGLDTMAEMEAIRRGWVIEGYPARWDQHSAACPQWHAGADTCKMAGHRRNHEMIALGADLVIAFPMGEESSGHSKGTWGCARAAMKAELPLVVLWNASFFPWGVPAQQLLTAESQRSSADSLLRQLIQPAAVKVADLVPIPF